MVRRSSALRAIVGLVLAAAAGPAHAGSVSLKAIYGSDDRKEVASLRARWVSDARATVALVQRSRLENLNNGFSRLPQDPLGATYRLCPDQRFRPQPTAAFCSGVLVANDTVVTAGHCVDAGSLAGTRFVFGYRTVHGKSRTTIRNTEIYSGKRVSVSISEPGGRDFAIVELDRPVTGVTPARLKRSGRAPSGRPIHVIGHPSGLPAKVASGAEVGRVLPTRFLSDLDTFEGNSGSPVFDSATHEVLGILVDGQADYVARGSCNVVNVLPSRSAGEGVVHASIIATRLPRR